MYIGLHVMYPLLTYLLTPCSRVLLEKLTGFAANQEIPRILWNAKVHYRTHKRPPPFSCCVMPPLETPPSPPEIRVGKYFTSGLFCLQKKHLAHDYFITEFFFHGEELLAPRPTPKLEYHPLSAVRDCLFNLFAATLNIGGRSSIRNLRTRHAVMTGTHKHGMYPLFLSNLNETLISRKIIEKLSNKI